MRAIQQLLETTRLVTITGLGGTGKTSLALRIQEMTDAHMIDLSTITTGEGAVAVAASTLGIAELSTRSPIEQLRRHLADRDDVLIFDNCEHVVEAAAALIDDILASAPNVRILATSTQQLGLADEHIYELSPLSVPTEYATLEQVRAIDSCALFEARVRKVRPDFEISEQNYRAVIDICRKLDGLPLAIELAAVRMRVLSPQELSERLDQRFALLSAAPRNRPARHQTLRALVEWSLERCEPEQRVLWARLSVFNGSFELETAEAVCGFGELEPGRVLDLLDGLVSRSLLTVDYGDRVRYRQLATIREFGTELLAERGETETCRANLFEVTMRTTRSMVDRWCGPGQGRALASWRSDHPTLMSVLAWAAAQPARVAAAAELVGLLRYHWVAGGQLSDGRAWSERLLASADLSVPCRGDLLIVATWTCLMQGDLPAAEAHLIEAERIADATDHARLVAHIHTFRGMLHLFSGELDPAVDEFDRARRAATASPDPGVALFATFQLALAQTLRGDHVDARDTCREQIAACERTGEQWHLAYTLWVSALASWRAGALDDAEAASRRALVIQEEFQDGICIALVLHVLAWITAKRSNRPGAVRLTRAAASVWRHIGTEVSAFGPHLAAEAARRMPRGDLAALPMSKLQAVRVGLAEGNAPEAADVPGMSARELEVLAQLVEGRSNKQIAERLVISQRTVEGHVHRILTKLGLRSRAEVPSWYARQQTIGTFNA